MCANYTFVQGKTAIAAAVGAGVLIGAAGLCVYHSVVQKRKLKLLQQHMARLDLTLSELHKEFLAARDSRNLRSRRQSVKSNRSKTNSFSSARSGNELEDDMFSTSNTEDDEEFYDLNSDEEESLLKSLTGNSVSEETNKLFEEIDILMKGNDEDRLNAFNTLKRNELELSENPDFLWRYAKGHQMQATASGAQKDMNAKKKYVFEGLEYASKALALDETNPDAHKWFAILTGMQADFISVKEKIQNGYLFQKHVLIALENKPDDYSLHHLLGRFKFEVANTSWVEKKIAASLFAELPSLTFANAISDLLTAEQLNPVPWKENRLLLAKCYIGDGKYEKAMEWLESAKEITPRTKDEEACDQEIDILMVKYKKYRK